MRSLHGTWFGNGGMAAALAALLLVISCTKKETPPPVVEPVPEPVVEAVPQPEQEFDDPELQTRYEEEFQRNVESFTPPAIGTLVAARLQDGTFIGGSLARIDTNGISLKVGNKEFVASKSDLDPATLADLYVDEFARQYAIAEVSAPPPLATPGATPIVRYALKDTLDTHEGPGIRYARLKNLLVSKGVKLDVQQRRGRWLKVTAPTVKPGLAFWVDYFQTIPLNEDLQSDYTPYVLMLLEQGLLERINAEQNEVFVNEEAWNGTEPAVQEGMSRLLAAHCAQAKKSSVFWVDVKGAQSSRRLGKYSRAQGFRAM